MKCPFTRAGEISSGGGGREKKIPRDQKREGVKSGKSGNGGNLPQCLSFIAPDMVGVKSDAKSGVRQTESQNQQPPRARRATVCSSKPSKAKLMPSQNVSDYLRDLASRVAQDLWKVARREVTSARLVLPTYRDGGTRLSEQEARSIAQRIVADGPYFFSVETPTLGRHSFTGKGKRPRSAQHDMSLYVSPADPPVAHIEFKQGHKSDKGGSGVQVIAKDLEKLVSSARESSSHSLWFHSFREPTKNEFSKLQGFFSRALAGAVLKATPPTEARVVLAFCAVVDAPVIWLAGPVPWSEVRGLIDGFPVVGQAHPAWSRIEPDHLLEPPVAGLKIEEE